MKKYFGFFQAADKDGNVETTSTMVKANSKDEAVGQTYRLCKKVYPASDGYHEHNATMTEFPEDF